MIDLKSAAAYIKNSWGGAAVNTFMRDADPIGKSLLDELKKLDYVWVAGDRITLTEKGLSFLGHVPRIEPEKEWWES